MANDRKQQGRHEQQKAVGMEPGKLDTVTQVDPSGPDAMGVMAEAAPRSGPPFRVELRRDESGEVTDAPVKTPADITTALKHLVRAKVPARLEQPLQALIGNLFEHGCMRGDREILRSLNLLRDLLAAEHLHADDATNIVKAIEALA